ncbi:hypothetical protein BDW66DRAFT_162994 [Aspergillus desertorum]
MVSLPPASFSIAVGISFLMIQLLFLGNLSYLYGTKFKESERVHNLNLLYVDYDGGIIDQSVSDAYTLLQSSRNAVCSGDYWGAIYALPGASSNLESALANENSTPTTLTYVWNGARYAAVSQSAVYTNLQTLVQTTRSTYYANNASAVLLTNINAMDGSRALYNSVSMIMPIIMQFFFMMAMNGISPQYRLFTTLSPRTNGIIRMGISVLYTFISALCMIGYIWAFREGWAVNGNQFVLSWMTVWLYMHINFMFFDILTTFVPMQYMSFCVITWAITNVSSTISPFELNPGFYRWAHALPAHETYVILAQIWSDGCNNQLYRALPILFSWWTIGIAVHVYAAYYRCEQARMLEQKTVQSEPKTPVGSPDRIPLRNRRATLESFQAERRIYGPSYPTMPSKLDDH